MKALIFLSLLLGFSVSHAKVIHSLDCSINYEELVDGEVVEKSLDFKTIKESKKAGSAMLHAENDRFEAYISIRDGKTFSMNMTAKPLDTEDFNFGEIIDTAEGKVSEFSTTEASKMRKAKGVNRIPLADVFCKKVIAHMDVPISI